MNGQRITGVLDPYIRAIESCTGSMGAGTETHRLNSGFEFVLREGKLSHG